MELKVVEYGTEEYKKMVELRNDILLAPIGLPYYDKVLVNDPHSLLCVGFDQDEAIGCCVLTDLGDGLIQLRQMAVATDRQRMGIGTKIITFAEEVARENGFIEIMLHAQRVAEIFYLKNGYHFVGDQFEEVGIAHMEMRKQF